MVILTEKEAKQYRELESILKKVDIDLDKLVKIVKDFDIIKSSLQAIDLSVSLLNQRVQDLELNKKMTNNPSPKQILSELMGDEVSKINEEI
jgi:hypothetical protein